MSLLNLILLIIIYILSVGYWSMLFAFAGVELKPKFAKVMVYLMFVPGVNTAIAFFVFMSNWLRLIARVN